MTVLGPVEAEEFVVRDSNGSTRAVLGVVAKEGVGLSLRDHDGKTRCKVGVEYLNGKSLAGLVLYDRQERRRAEIEVGDDGTPSISLCDEKQEPGASLSVLADGSPFLCFHNSTGVRGGVTLDLAKDGSPRVEIKGKDGKVLFKASP